ncbi:hypothetical protein TIFTF001_011623 [Ficus carica]|uniref:Uncharacterized protein n=1 Tax=Ficus carica TaxID=3494 RepID=A0AA88AAU5_FICCA|nr:hypothetical protein TIFTF001_011623 [Ficus carica]
MRLMAFGFAGAVFDGFPESLPLLFVSRMINSIGSSSKLDGDTLRHRINKNAVAMLFLACIYIICCLFSRCHICFVSNIFAFIGGYMVAFILVWQLAMVALPLTLLLVIPGWLCGRSMMDLAGKIRREFNNAGTIAEKAISSIRTVFAFVGEKQTLAEFSLALNGCTKLGLRQGLVKGLAIGSNATVFAIWSFLSYYGSRLVMHDGVQGGTVFAAGVSVVKGGLALGAPLSNMKDMAEACSAGKHVWEVIKRAPKIDSEDMKGIILDVVSGKVEFKQATALVGASGSGKSTALSLLQRFYDPLEGEILLDGISIDKLQLKWLRSQMALVSQEPSLFSASIKENILFGKEDAQMEEILEASTACDAHSFISQLPQGYDTQVGSPTCFSIVICLEIASLGLVQRVGERGRTTIVVAHRLSTIKNADVIAVVENGQVKEIGSHDWLIKEENGLDTSLIRLQRMEIEKSKDENNCDVLSPSSNKDFDDAKRNNCLSDVSKSNPTNFVAGSVGSLARINNSLKDSKSSTPSYWRLFRLNRPEWKQATIGCLSAIIFGAIQPLYAIAMGTTVSVYFLTDHEEIKERIRTFALWFLGLSVFSFLINLSQHYSFAYMGEHLTKRIRERMFQKILTFEVGWFDKEENSSSIVCSRLAKDANVVRTLVGDKMSLLLQATSAVTIAWTMGLVISWRLAIVSIAVQPLIIACF